MRDLEELLVELAHEYRRPLAEVHDLLVGALGGLDVAAVHLGLDLLDALADYLVAAPLGEHVRGLEHGLVGARLAHHVLARAEDPVATGGVGARDVRVGHRDDLGAEQAADPADRTHEGRVLGAPALAAIVGPLQSRDRRLGDLREDRQGRLGVDVQLGEDVLAAVRALAADKLVGREARLARESLGGLGRPALGVEGDVGRRALLDLVDLGRGLGYAGDDHGKPARRRAGADLSVREPGLVELAGDQLGELALGVHERCRGHLLGAYLE